MKPKIFILAALLILGLWLRFTGLRWGFDQYIHPDEARIAYMVGDTLTHNGNPRYQAYGHLPIYLQTALFKLRVWTGLATPDHFQETIVSGRIVASLLSLGTVYFTFRIAALLSLSFWWGILAALGALCFPLATQLSQYSTVDAHVTFFTTWTLFEALALRKNGRARDLFWLCFGLGGALACKASAFPLLVVTWLSFAREWKSVRFWLIPIGALFAFALFQPYAWLDGRGFLNDVSEQAAWVRGQHPPIFFHQYENSLIFLFSLRDLFLYSVGPIGFLLATAGVVFSIRNRTPWILAAWFFTNVLVLGTSYAKFSRYWLPLIPLFAIYAALALHRLRRKWLALIFSAWTVFAAIAVHTIHLQRHPNSLALAVLKKLSPTEKPIRLLSDSIWVGLPVGTPQKFAELFELQNDPGYAHRIAEKFEKSDYFLTTNHLAIRTAYEQIGRKYIQAQTFEALKNGTAGYTLRAAVSIHPWFAAGFFQDFLLDYSIPIYDHPTLLIWQNSKQLSATQIEKKILNTEVISPNASLEYFNCRSKLRSDCETDTIVPIRRAAHIPTSDLSSILEPKLWQPLVWYLFFFFVGLVFLPFTHKWLPGSFAAGYGSARAIGLVLSVYVLWLASHLPGDIFTPGPVRLLGIGIWMLLILAGIRSGFWKLIPLKEMGICEALFFTTFLLFFVFRIFAPDIHWSENPVDLSYLSILTKASSMPPPDPGYSGTSLNYYYYGFLLFSLPAKFLGLPPNIAYPLSAAMVPSLVAGLLFTLGASMDQERPNWKFGLASVALVLLIGNWDGAVQFFGSWLHFPSHTRAFDFFRSAHEVIRNTVHEFPLWSYLFVDLHAHILSGILFLQFLVWLRFTDLSRLSSMQILLGAVLLGSMGPSNTWDYFTASVLLLVITLHNVWHTKEISHAKPTLWLLAISYLLFSPFYLIFTKKLAQLGVGFVGAEMTDLHAAIICMGVFLIVLYIDFARSISTGPMIVTFALFCLLSFAFHREPWALLLYAGAGIGAISLYLFRNSEFPQLRSDLLAGFGALILVMCEIFYIKDWLQGGEWKRMNTVFKFYYQTWFLFALIAPAAISRIFSRQLTDRQKGVYCGVVAAAILTAALWPIGGVKARVADHAFQRQGRFEVTFDGLNWLKHLRPHEYQTIAWLWKNGTMDDVLLEAGNGDYQYEYNVVSSASGVPTVQSWWSHTEQRDRPYEERSRLVAEFYKTKDLQNALRVLKRFHVTYVYAAEREKEQYGNTGFQKFKDHPEIFEPLLSFSQGALYHVKL